MEKESLPRKTSSKTFDLEHAACIILVTVAIIFRDGKCLSLRYARKV